SEQTHLLEALCHSVTGYVFEVCVGGVAIWDVELGKGVLYLLQLDVATLGDSHGAGEDCGCIFEDAAHLVSVLYEELVAVEFQAVSVMDGFAGLHADEN